MKVKYLAVRPLPSQSGERTLIVREDAQGFRTVVSWTDDPTAVPEMIRDYQASEDRACVARESEAMEERRVSALANERAGKYGRTMEARFGLGFDAMYSDGALHDGTVRQ